MLNSKQVIKIRSANFRNIVIKDKNPELDSDSNKKVCLIPNQRIIDRTNAFDGDKYI